nr:ribosomal protein S18-alanine N-acetyltransferase [Motiliproteus sp. SC1-56]
MALEQTLFDDPWSLPALERFLQRGDPALGLEEGGQLVGYLLCGKGADEADLLRVAVRAEKRRRGLAVKLLQHLFKALESAGVGALYLEVRLSNEAAIACYQGQGFETLGVRKQYYPAPGGREDAMLMRRYLNAAERAAD